MKRMAGEVLAAWAISSVVFPSAFSAVALSASDEAARRSRHWPAKQPMSYRRPRHERDRADTRTVRPGPLLRTVLLTRFACPANCLSTNVLICACMWSFGDVSRKPNWDFSRE